MHALLAYIALHPVGALLAVFLVAFMESIVLVGTLVPAGVTMFAAGALIGAGALDMWTTLGIAALGAIGGDGLSYEAGRRWNAQIRAWKPLARRAALIERGEQFVRDHGGKSILFARFIAPVRAIVPFLAGTACMPRLRFYAVNIGSALVWSPTHILPGVLFGASLQVARAVSGRIAALLLLTVALAWFVAWLARLAARGGAPVLRGWRDALLRWASRSPAPYGRLRRYVRAVIDPSRPDSRTLLFWILVLGGGSLMFLLTARGAVTAHWFTGIDMSVLNRLQALRTWPADQAMVAITEMGGVRMRVLVVAAMTLWLWVRGCRRTMRYWLALALATEATIRALGLLIDRPAPLGLPAGLAHVSFPSGHATSSIILYGFLAYLLGRNAKPYVRATLAACATAAIVLIGVSRLYLGAYWLSDVVAGWSIGLVWLALAIILYTRRQVHEFIHPRALAATLAVVCAAGISWVFSTRSTADLALYTPPLRVQAISLHQWTDSEWDKLPAYRLELRAHRDERFLLQWADSAPEIERALQAGGWLAAPAWSVRSALTWLLPSSDVRELPVLPRYDQGSNAAMTYLRPSRDGHGRIVLRLWRSNYVLETPQRLREIPVWYGAFYDERFAKPAHLFLLGITHGVMAPEAFLPLLPPGLRTLRRPDDASAQSQAPRQAAATAPGPAMQRRAKPPAAASRGRSVEPAQRGTTILVMPQEAQQGVH
ncbi:bifunctional DedA family/phosphatase PAP2 family protein [Candidimonas nitroreducens]|uniref:Phosphatidic acid phosphatase type 2/haloperoxidase domain-containing protein n=1 Tax=Candidimonas nitroreducens TaxID=683354 RepID=A0A225MW00_9BURK|nr:bifunctional DedA family/phosphatase PAP2 family protein [Candidimonas nitroreducens]OWT65448.1 hypothetical protein CEY11_01505 [Candidimonas nitroreducens]